MKTFYYLHSSPHYLKLPYSFLVLFLVHSTPPEMQLPLAQEPFPSCSVQHGSLCPARSGHSRILFRMDEMTSSLDLHARTLVKTCPCPENRPVLCFIS